jgi:hypothetical protein
MLMYETWQEFAEGIGAAKYGADWLTASYLVIQGDRVGTHCDAITHIRDLEAPGPEGIPLEYCFSVGGYKLPRDTQGNCLVAPRA